MLNRPLRALILYWGRRGLSIFVRDFARAALAGNALCPTISVSRQNTNFEQFTEFGNIIFPVTTFSHNIGALTKAWQIVTIRKRLAREIERNRIEVVIDLLPHVWAPFVVQVFKAAGIPYVTVIHDAEYHPGDYRSATASGLSRRSLRQSDLVITLSGAVAGRVEALGIPPEKICTILHPDLDFGGRHFHAAPKPDEPLRLMFFGRIMYYKGLPLFLNMVEELKQEGLSIKVGVFGEGSLGECELRLKAMGAEVVNRWLTEAEVADAFSRYHAVVLSHIEASQSGVAAAAMGAGLPVIATPVGGLLEQVHDGITGVIAERADAISMSAATKRLILNSRLYESICHNIEARRDERSMARFIDSITQALRTRLGGNFF